MKRARWLLAWLLLAAIIAVCIVFGRAFIHFWGIDTQQSDNYDFMSGPGPVWVSALGLSTIITGMAHHVNCHEPGCWRIGKHKVDGTPWCNRHHRNARPEESVGDKLDRIIALLERDRP
jgi:hypothetical protein